MRLPRKTPIATALLIGTVTLVSLTGCASADSKTLTQLDDSLTASISAVATARLALALQVKGSSSVAVADTAVRDMQRELGDAKTGIDQADVTSAAVSRQRRAVSAAIQRSILTLASIRVYFSGARAKAAGASLLSELTADRKSLTAAERALKAAK